MKIVKNLEKYSLTTVAFLQALGIFGYCALVAVIFWKGNEWFGNMNSYLGPVIVLTLLSVSVLICGLLAFGYPVVLFWEEKKTKTALRLIFLTSCWLLAFFLLALISIKIF
jgi:hypothetical protein